MLSCRMNKLQGDELEPALLEARDDGTNERPLHAVGLLLGAYMLL